MAGGHAGGRGPPKDSNAQNARRSFAADVAAATGKHPAIVRRATRRGRALAKALEPVKGTSLDKGVEPYALTKPGREALIDPAAAAERSLYQNQRKSEWWGADGDNHQLPRLFRPSPSLILISPAIANLLREDQFLPVRYLCARFY